MKKSVAFLFILIAYFATAQESPKFEFRAAWVATVSNIDWPSKPGLPFETQKKEVVELLDLLQKNGLNAVILQVRPSADAIYPSSLVPWSKYLTGTPGVAPDKFYDPLKFWIDESHKRGMEFHAWFNPFRVAQNSREPLAGNHVAFIHPDWIVQYGDRLYFDPGIPEIRNHIAQVVMDVVNRYDVDAIHFDDYFYPYPLNEDFPDTASFARFNRGFSIENKADWRRGNVDMIIKILSDSIKAAKPWVKFGISPFGVWRNKADDPLGSETTAGTTNYDHLYADVVKWQKEGWIDYLLPQLYWQIGHPSVDFKTLCRWWERNSCGRSMYIGHAVYKVAQPAEVKAWASPTELPRQVQTIRSSRGIGGSAYFSSNHFQRDLLGFQDSLQHSYYELPALVPPMPWLDNIPPPPPIKFRKSGKKIKWKEPNQDNEFDRQARFIVYKNRAGEVFNSHDPQFIDRVTDSNKLKFHKEGKKKVKYEVRVSALDRLNNESETTKSVKIKM